MQVPLHMRLHGSPELQPITKCERIMVKHRIRKATKISSQTPKYVRRAITEFYFAQYQKLGYHEYKIRSAVVSGGEVVYTVGSYTKGDFPKLKIYRCFEVQESEFLATIDKIINERKLCATT